VALELGVPLLALGNLQVDVPGGRNRRVQLGGLTLLDETYNASPEAVLAALDLLALQPGRRFAVLGTMLELGEQSEALHRRVGERALERGLDGLVVVASAPDARAIAEAASPLPRVVVVERPEQAAEPLARWLRKRRCAAAQGQPGRGAGAPDSPAADPAGLSRRWGPCAQTGPDQFSFTMLLGTAEGQGAGGNILGEAGAGAHGDAAAQGDRRHRAAPACARARRARQQAPL